MIPKKIKVRDKEFLEITWDDDKIRSIKLSNLRSNCPCAICHSEKDEWSESYIPLYTKEQLTIAKISIVGTYAVGVEWEDGHNTGIYDYDFLFSLFEKFSVV